MVNAPEPKSMLPPLEPPPLKVLIEVVKSLISKIAPLTSASETAELVAIVPLPLNCKVPALIAVAPL